LTFQTSIEIEAPTEIVWGVIRDVERWPEWTPTVTSVRRLDSGLLIVGSRARIRQPRLPRADWRVTVLEDGRGFTWVSASPGVRVTAHHWVEARAGGSRATLSVAFAGLFGSLVGRLTRTLNERYLRLEAEGLKRRSEERSAMSTESRPPR
jgi:uncharacterized membrane protein